jgi:Leucine Rich repeats (2 copies)
LCRKAINILSDYFGDDATGALTEPITRLLRDETTDNSRLILELIAGGGVNRRLLAYLFALAVFHHERPVADYAFSLLRRLAADDTLRQADRLRNTVPLPFNESDFISKYSSLYFDIFDFLLAYKMCNWHRNGQFRSSYFVIAHQTLNLSAYAESTLSPAFATLNFVRHLTLPAIRHFDFQQAIPLLHQLPLESIHIENMRLPQFPVELFELHQLVALTIRRGSYRPRTPMRVPDGAGTFGSATLEKLDIEGYLMSNEQQLGPFPRLKQLDMVRCGLESIDWLIACEQLSHLDLRYNHIAELPPVLSQLKHLEKLDLEHNPITKFNTDLSALQHLKEYKISFMRNRIN